MDQPIPVICERCRAHGTAGDDPFSHLADLLSFTPVPRRAHANGWSPEHQRAFIAALAVTGSAPKAARALGRHAFGAEQLRRAKGGASFAAAWDAALDLCRERELSALQDGLAELAAEQQVETAHRRSLIVPASDRDSAAAAHAAAFRPPATFDRNGNQLFTAADEQDYRDAMERIKLRLTSARRLLLAILADDPAHRAAWETLVGPVDWDRAKAMEAQADEPAGDAEWPMRNPDMVLVVESGLVPDITGDAAGAAALQLEFDRVAAAKAAPPAPDLSPEEAAIVASYRAMLIAGGWTDDGHGGLLGPEGAA